VVSRRPLLAPPKAWTLASPLLVVDLQRKRQRQQQLLLAHQISLRMMSLQARWLAPRASPPFIL
jgi:hypothetical protein